MTARALTCFVVSVMLCSIAAPSHADDVDGEWTGSLELRGNYFLERSTRVVVPTASLALVSPTGLRIGGDVLIDSITSASIGQGAQTDDLFTERRWGVGVSVGRTHELSDDRSFDWTLFGRYSTENDYFARAIGFDSLLSLAQHCSLFRLNATFVADTVEKTSDLTFKESLTGVSWRASYEQVLTPTLVATVAWDFAYLDGFLANAYRTIPVPGEGRLDENHPNTRFRHAPSLQLRWHIPFSRTSFHVRLRAYDDTWDVRAGTVDGRIYQELGEHFVARVRFRHVDQTSSYFFDNQFRTVNGERVVTADPKMENFDTQELGLKLEWRFPWLEGIGLQDAWFDASFDRRWNNNRFGNAVIAQVGMRVPF